MLVRVDMNLKTPPGVMWARYLSDDQHGPLKELTCLKAECELVGVGDSLIVLLSDAPFPDDMPHQPSLTTVVSYDDTLRTMTRFLPDETAASPFERLLVRTKWLEASSLGDTLYVRILAPSIAQDAEMPQDDDMSDVTDIDEQKKNFSQFLRHYVVEEPDAVLYSKDLWALWSSLNPRSTPGDEETAGIRRVNVWRYLRPLFPEFPPSIVERIGPETHRYWAGYTLRDEGTTPNCPAGCSCSVR